MVLGIPLLLQECFHLLYFYKIIDCKGGAAHTIALTEEGYVFGWGQNDKIFSINVDELLSDNINIIEEIKINDIKDINKISCGLDYILLLNANNQCFLIQNKKNEIKLLNEDIKGDIFDISSGDSFFFLITKLNSMGFYENLFEEIKKYSNTNDVNSLFDNYSNTFDIILSQDSNSLVKYACHSYVLEFFIDTKKLQKDSNTVNNNINYYLIPSLKNDEILILLEVLYINNINRDNLNKDIDKYMELESIIKKIISFINEYGIESNTKSLKDLLLLYQENISRYIKNFKNNSYILTNEEKHSEIMKMILKSFNAVIKSQSGGYFEEEEKKLAEEELKKKKEGIKISNFEINNLNATLNIDYYKQYKLEVDYIFSFYKKIAQLKIDINTLKKNFIKNNLHSLSSFQINYNNKSIILNKDIITQKSKYFNNIINIMNINEFNMDDIDLNFDNNIIEYFINYLKGEKCEIKLKDIIELLDISYYFMADNLFYLITIQLENIIKSDNILTLIEIAKDYDLKLFYNSCLIYMTANIIEMREKGLLKFLKDEDRINLRRIMELNNIK